MMPRRRRRHRQTVECVSSKMMCQPRASEFSHGLDPQRTSERGAAGEPDGHPPIGDLDALTDCTALTIVNCPSKKPTVPHFGARVARKPQSAESATGQLAYAALRSRTGRVVAAVRRSTEADASTRTRLTPLLRQFLPEWPDGNTCAGIRSTYSCWIGGSQLQGIVEPNG